MPQKTILNPDFDYEFRWNRDFGSAINRATSPLPQFQSSICCEAAEQFIRDFREKRHSPELEYLEGPEDSNLYILYPLKDSRTLSIVLAIEEFEEEKEGVCVLANAGLQDDMKRWAADQFYDFDPILAASLAESNGEKDVLEIARLRDFESWTQFLHPEQKFLAYKSWLGPARIEGAAGTGKTVIGLHYAATLAHRFPDEKILYTTKRGALLTQFQTQFRRLSQVSNVVFQHVDKIAHDTVPETNPSKWKTKWVDNTKVSQGFDDAYNLVIEGTNLTDLGKQYLRDEIESVILGNGISSLDEYCQIERLGRLCLLPTESQELVWALHSAWEDLLIQSGTPRFADKLIEARNITSKNKHGIYRSIIVDEVQDMPIVAMQLIRALLVGDSNNPLPEDSLLMLGDVAQQIFPGGLSLARAGIEVENRTHILYKNYRNSKPIFEAARQIRGKNFVTRNAVDFSLVQTTLESTERPQFIRVGPGEDKLFVGNEILKLLQNPGVEETHIGILTRHHRQAQFLMEYLTAQRRIRCTLIDRDDTPMGDGVHLGSFNRTKGWEFRIVFIPFLANSLFPDISQYTPTGIYETGRENANQDLADIHEEALILEKGRLYAAMTRARDRLYLIADDDPFVEIQNARRYFEWKESQEE